MGRIDTEQIRSDLIAQLSQQHAAGISAKAAAGDSVVLHDLGNALGSQLCEPGVSEQLVQVAVATGALAAGAMFAALVQRCIDADAEIQALKEIQAAEAATRNDPDNYLFQPMSSAIRGFVQNAR